MRIRKLLAAFIFVLAYLYRLRLIKAATWNYQTQSDWQAAGYEKCSATGSRQSPIDIVTSQVVPKLNYRLEFINYDQPLKPRVMPSWLPGTEYVLNEIHFHWGLSADELGSEHKIDGVARQAEMHLVHVKSGLNKEDIPKNSDSLLVIGAFIQTPFGAQQVNPSLDAATREVNQVSGTDQTYASETRWSPSSFLPNTRDKFYSYLGSLTTPPCFEVVNWVVMRDAVFLSPEVLAGLASCTAKHVGSLEAAPIAPNYRDVMPLQNRSVAASFNSQTEYNINNNNPLDNLLSGIFKSISITGLKRFFPIIVVQPQQFQGGSATTAAT